MKKLFFYWKKNRDFFQHQLPMIPAAFLNAQSMTTNPIAQVHQCSGERSCRRSGGGDSAGGTGLRPAGESRFRQPLVGSTSRLVLISVPTIFEIASCNDLRWLTVLGYMCGHSGIWEGSILLTVGRPASYDTGIRGKPLGVFPPNPLSLVLTWGHSGI